MSPHEVVPPACFYGQRKLLPEQGVGRTIALRAFRLRVEARKTAQEKLTRSAQFIRKDASGEFRTFLDERARSGV